MRYRVWTNAFLDLVGDDDEQDDDFLRWADVLQSFEVAFGSGDDIITDTDVGAEGSLTRVMSWLTIEAADETEAIAVAQWITRLSALHAGFPRIEIMGGGAEPHEGTNE